MLMQVCYCSNRNIFVVVLFLFFISISSAATLSVNGTGANCLVGTQTNYSTIQSAVNAASAGDTIYVCKNSTVGYTESIVVNQSINIYGNESGVSVIASNSLPVFWVNSTYFNITNFTLNGGYTGIKLNSTAHFSHIYNVTAHGATEGFYIISNYNVINNNTARNNTDNGFLLNLSNNTNLTNNIAYNNTYNGFLLFPGHNNTLTNNTAYNQSSFFGFSLELGSSNNVLTNNTAYLNQEGFYLNASSSNNLTLNTGRNNTVAGFQIMNSSSNNRFVGNTAHNNSAAGFSLVNSSNNNYLANNTAYSNLFGFSLSLSSSNTLVDNLAYGHSFGNFNLANTSNEALNNNTAHGGNVGFSFSTSSNGTISNNTAYNNTIIGFRFISFSLNNTILSNTAYNNSNFGFSFGSSSSNSTLTSNIAYNNSLHGFDFDSSSNNILSNNTAYTNSFFGFNFASFSNNTISNNTAYSNLYHGFGFEESSLNNTLTNNSAYLNSLIGFSFDTSHNSTLSNNSAYNNSQSGFVFNNTSQINLSGNNATNNTLVQYQIIDYSNVTFTGTNRALLTPSTGLDLNITNGSNVTTLVSSTYNNFTTSYGTIFFDNARNVSIKLMNLSDSGASSTGCSIFTGTCTLLTLSNNLVNISNASATGTIILGMYYDTSTSPTSSNVYIGKYVTANSGWNQVGQTAVDTANGTVRYGAITSFSTFGIVNFVASSSPPSSGDSPVQSLEIDYDFTCSNESLNGSLEVSTISGAEVSLVELSPTYIQLEKKEADSDGKALFTITENGTYKIRATKSGYTSAEEDNLEFNLCEEKTSEAELECTTNTDCSSTEQCLNNECVPVTGECGYASNHEFVSYECCSNSDCEQGYECKENTCSVIQSIPPSSGSDDDDQPKVLEKLNSVQEALDKAKSEGRDITEAEKKLVEAFAAYEAGQYEKAQGLADQSLLLIKDQQPPGSRIESKPESEQQQSDSLGLLLIAGSVVVVVIILAGAHFFLKGGNKGFKFKK